jgi:hypothetical protein
MLTVAMLTLATPRLIPPSQSRVWEFGEDGVKNVRL